MLKARVEVVGNTGKEAAMSRRPAFLFVVAGVFAATACGGGDATGWVPGTGAGTDPASGSGNTGADKGGGVDHGSGVSGGGGSTTPHTCVYGDICAAGAYCTAKRDTPGYCVDICAAPNGTSVVTVACPAGEVCVDLKSSEVGSVCFLPCSDSSKCPALEGFDAQCLSVDGVPGAATYCVWIPKSDTAPPTPIPADAG
jgi:hypothetical protein